MIIEISKLGKLREARLAMRILMLMVNSFLGLRSRSGVPRNMKGGVLARPGVAALAVLLFGLSACASYDPGIEVQGGINGHDIATTVDTPEAKYYLESYLEGLGGDPKLETALDQALAKLSPSRIDMEEFQVLAENFSRDLATLHLIKRLSEIPENARIQVTYWRQIEGLRALTGGKGDRGGARSLLQRPRNPSQDRRAFTHRRS